MLWIIIKSLDLPEPRSIRHIQGEYRFAHPRRWRFDFAWPEYKIAIEYEGIITLTKKGYRKSRHLTPIGYSNDCEKYSVASIMGWTIIRVTALMIQDGRAYKLIEQAFTERNNENTRT